ncbi:MAG: hypothetical protein K1Y36_01340 [Blastocatellia bacterium]|nr:hypothetical protein [Blastocatellia bacterium]
MKTIPFVHHPFRNQFHRKWIFLSLQSSILSPVLSVGLLAGCIWGGTGMAGGQSAPGETLSEEWFRGHSHCLLTRSEWKYQPHDNPSFAQVNVDDAGWLNAPTQFKRAQRLPGWQGIGWFRNRLTVDASLVEQPLVLKIEQRGAMEIFLDGGLLAQFGSVSSSPVAERVGDFAPKPLPLVFRKAGEHVLAVRFSAHESAAWWYTETPIQPQIFGFGMRLETTASSNPPSQKQNFLRTVSRWMCLTLCGLLVCLHVNWFRQDRQWAQLYQVGMLLAVAALVGFAGLDRSIWLAHAGLLGVVSCLMAGWILPLILVQLCQVIFDFPRLRLQAWFSGGLTFAVGGFLLLGFFLPQPAEQWGAQAFLGVLALIAVHVVMAGNFVVRAVRASLPQARLIAGGAWLVVAYVLGTALAIRFFPNQAIAIDAVILWLAFGFPLSISLFLWKRRVA